ncbi:hypothetical protein F8G81_02475 [Arthrobacter sp. CDRTa11]|uniref:hypothetical protein n=1 Tax=Arthrobacter sp. CDRTa11 TaxID=2651199 RepID=UPI002265B898|nr:hypothetical protein [Arthrobacter sp. CDRTa11]UZX01613.1 hypothetical protein F8G81_02475 [Arthrobacter sp. CDRTa11]
MEQTESNGIGFREVDQNGRAVDPETAGSTGTGAAPGSQAGNLRLNPFIIILWILAVGLNAAAVWGYVNAFSQGPIPGNMGPQVAFFVLSFAPLAGTLTVISLLFWHAVQWRRRST